MALSRARRMRAREPARSALPAPDGAANVFQAISAPPRPPHSPTTMSSSSASIPNDLQPGCGTTPVPWEANQRAQAGKLVVPVESSGLEADRFGWIEGAYFGRGRRASSDLPDVRGDDGPGGAQRAGARRP